jgi:hypothetical protein
LIENMVRIAKLLDERTTGTEKEVESKPCHRNPGACGSSVLGRFQPELGSIALAVTAKVIGRD